MEKRRANGRAGWLVMLVDVLQIACATLANGFPLSDQHIFEKPSARDEYGDHRRYTVRREDR